jgi:hypothetical protein
MYTRNDSIGQGSDEARKSATVTQLRVGPRAFPASAGRARPRHEQRTNHPEYPLERLCTHLYEPFQLTFARHAQQLFEERDDVELVASHQGLAIRGETEAEIEAALTVLKDFYGHQLRVGPTTIRYHEGATLEEPWMGLRVRCSTDQLEAVKADLVVRGATIVSSEIHSSIAVIQACAPLAYLISYASALADLTSGSAEFVMWLSHYAPVQGGPPGGDAA